MGPKKQAISVRVGEADLGNLRKLAKRLGVRDSDVIRVAIKTLLSKWSPLHDSSVRGRSLVPVFLENGTELFRHFDLDAPRLDSIINEGVHAEGRVELEDIQLLSMSGIQRSYLRWRLEQVGNSHHVNGVNGQPSTNNGAHVNGANVNGHVTTQPNGHLNGHVDGHLNGHLNGDSNAAHAEGVQVEQSLRQYLYEKYVHARTDHHQTGTK